MINWISQNRTYIKKAVFFITFAIIFSVVMLNVLHRGFNRDEFESLHSAWEISRGAKIYVDFFQNHNPLLYYLLVPIIKTSGENIRTIFAARFFVFLFFLLTILSTYLLGKIVFDKSTALYSVLILSSMPLFVQKAIEIKPDIAMIACLMLSIYLLFKYFHNKKYSLLIFSAIISGMAFLFLQKAVSFVFFIHLIILYKIIRRKYPFKSLILFSLIFLATLFPYALYLLLSHSLQAYITFPVKFTMIWLSNHSHKLTFIEYFFRWMNPVLTFFFGLGLIAFLKSEDQKILGGLSLGLLLSLFTYALVAPQYYMPALPFIALIVANVLKKSFNKQNIALFASLCLIIVPQIYHVYDRGNRSPGNKPSLQRVQYVLENTRPTDFVYDGHANFNIFRKDIDFFWFVLDFYRGALFAYKRLVLYNYDVYDLIESKKPKIISSRLINIKDPRIIRCYIQSPKYKDLYILKPDCKKTFRFLHKWEKTHDKSLVEQISTLEPSLLDFKWTFKLGNYFFNNREWENAIFWLEQSLRRNHVSVASLKMLLICYKNQKNEKKVEDIISKLSSLSHFKIGPYSFEDGGYLEALSFTQHAKKGDNIKIDVFIKPPSTFFGSTTFFAFEKNNNFYFGKDFSVQNFKLNGELYEFKGDIPIPPNIPSGSYDVYFTFRIPKIDYRYHVRGCVKVS